MTIFPLRKKAKPVDSNYAPPFEPVPQNVTIRMLRTDRGSNNGFDVQWFREGEKYKVSESLAKAFVDDLKVAVRI